MGIRGLLAAHEAVMTDPSAVADFWRDFAPQAPAPMGADAQAGFIIAFVRECRNLKIESPEIISIVL